jgi:hypothetical protein
VDFGLRSFMLIQGLLAQHSIAAWNELVQKAYVRSVTALMRLFHTLDR